MSFWQLTPRQRRRLYELAQRRVNYEAERLNRIWRQHGRRLPSKPTLHGDERDIVEWREEMAIGGLKYENE